MALVVGNADYKRMSLKNAVNDARDMGRALDALGFEVAVKENLEWDGFVRALGDFTQQAQDNEVRLFYYAGHGMEVNGRNYLNPVGPMPANVHDLRAKAIEVDAVITQLSHLQAGVSIVIVDACRSNPFLGVVRQTRGGSARGGLGEFKAPRGMVVAFSTGPEGNADDGADSRNSSFTRHLLHEMQTPGLGIEDVFKRARLAVDADTEQRQQPWLSTNLIGEFCFSVRADGSCGRR